VPKGAVKKAVVVPILITHVIPPLSKQTEIAAILNGMNKIPSPLERLGWARKHQALLIPHSPDPLRTLRPGPAEGWLVFYKVNGRKTVHGHERTFGTPEAVIDDAMRIHP